MKCKRSPLTVIGCPRSGTSMVAGIFAKHGYWVGSQWRGRKKYNEKGYFENRHVKKFMMDFFNDSMKKANKGAVYSLEPSLKPAFMAALENVLIKDGRPYDRPWLVKFGAAYYPAWGACYPGVVACVRRRPQAILKSGRRAWTVTPKRIETHTKVMDAVPGERRVDVDYDAVVDGDYSAIEELFKKEGVPMDKDLVDGFVDPALRHF